MDWNLYASSEDRHKFYIVLTKKKKILIKINSILCKFYEILPHIVNMLPSHDSFVKLIPLLALFLVYVQLIHFRVLQLVPRVMPADHAVN